MNDKWRNIFLIIGLVAVVIMALTFDISFKELWYDIQRAGYWLVAILGLWALLYAMNTLSWYVILRGTGPVPVSFWRMLKITISGFALNYATPVGLLGGEPYKIMEMTPFVGVQRASSSVLLFAMMHVFSHISFWLSGVIVYLILAAFGVLSLGVAMYIVLSLTAIGCSFGIYLFLKGYKNGLVVKTVNLLAKIPGLKNWGKRFAEKNQEKLEEIDSQIAALHAQSKKNFYLSFLLEFIGRVMQSAEIFFMLILFEQGGFDLQTFVFAFLILAFTSLFANLLFFMPLQIGGREGGFAMSVAQLGMTSEIGIFVSVICRIRELFWAAIGILIMKIGNVKTEKKSIE